jgi:hypothetical protein
MASHQPGVPTRPESPRLVNGRAVTMWDIAVATISRPLGASSGLLIVCLVVAELSSPTVRHISAGYPITVGFVTTFIAFVFTATVINQIITRRLQLRWERVRGIAMQGLNDELRVARDLLSIMEHGMAPFDVSLPVVAAARERVPLVVHRIVMDARANGRSANLIGELLQEAEWYPFARAGLAEVSAYIRVSLARWSPLLGIGADVSDASHSMLLNSAGLADTVSVLEVPLAEARLVEGIAPADVRSCFVTLWKLVSVAFVFIEESSANALGPSLDRSQNRPWKSAMRHKLALVPDAYLERWEDSRCGQANFEQELFRARDAVVELQADLIDLIPRDVPAEPQAHDR